MATRAPIGWPMLPTPDGQGRLRFRSLEASVRESIQVVLATRPGERLMRPDFGAGLDEFLNEPNTIGTRRRVHDVIAESLERWEDRIDVDRIEVLSTPEDPGILRIEIHYRPNRTGALEQISLSMSLEQA
jgi:phage baseplate assembly protein W